MKRIILLALSILIISSCKDEINVSLTKETGSISGKVLPANASAYVELYQGTIKATSNCNPDGYFTFNDITPGTYRIEVKAEGYGMTRINSIKVEDGEGYDAGIIELNNLPYPLVAVSPYDISINSNNRLSVSSHTSLRFGKEMDINSVESAIFITPELQNMTIRSSNSVYFYIEGDYMAGTEYILEIDTSASTIYGEKLEFKLEYKFNTDPFSVTMENITTLSSRSRIYIYFNSMVDIENLKNNFEIIPNVPVDVIETSSQYAFYLYPSATWAADSVQFKFSSDLQDKYGNSLGRDTTFVIKSEELNVERTDPVNGQYFVYTGNAISISANFSLDQSTVASNISILPSFDYSIAGSSLMESFFIYPDSTMAPNTEYTVTIGTGLKGLYGGHLKEPYVFTFKTR